MKYLQDYMNDGQTAALDKAGAFFAFSTDQFVEQKKPNTKYCNGPAGMICPIETYPVLMAELSDIYHNSIKQDLEENGQDAIILRELNNHEAFYTRDITSTLEALVDYPHITKDDVIRVFKHTPKK